jgi:dipeptidase E
VENGHSGKGKIFLGGGGNEVQSFAIDQAFMREFTSFRILYVPIAMESGNGDYDACVNWLSNALSQHLSDPEKLEIHPLYDPNSLSSVDKENFDGLYIGGGNTYFLRKALADTDFDTFIRSFLADGKSVYGGSAGAIVFGRSIATVAEENEIGEDAYSVGLSLLGEYSVVCHYAEYQYDNITQLVGSVVSPIIAIPETSGLIVQESEARVVGRDSIHIFSTGGVDVLQPGDSFSLILG